MPAPSAELQPVTEAVGIPSTEVFHAGQAVEIDSDLSPEAVKVLDEAEQILTDVLATIDEAVTPEDTKELESMARGTKRNGSEEVEEWDRVPE